jgi:hypothetical protein
MNNPWKCFLFLKLPAAALVLMACAQALAFMLSGVPMRRDRSDELALAVVHDPVSYRILLLADSTTRNATARFVLGEPGEVANLATNAYLALPGSLFLLQRYLSAHATSPEHVVIAMGPWLYHHDDDLREARYNMWHTFNLPDERNFLNAHVSGIGQRDWLPAIVDVQERLVEPFFSLLKQRYLNLRNQEAPRIDVGYLIADASAPVEFAARAETAADEAFAGRRDFTMSAENVDVLNRLCDLSRKHGFKIDIAWPPMPAQFHRMVSTGGALAELEAAIRSITAGRCDINGFTDFNTIRAYPNLSFHNDLLHLFGDGWEQRYAADMREYLAHLRRTKPT